MIKPRQNKLITAFFNRYIGFIIARNFTKLNYNIPQLNSKLPVLLIANHFSWWDGFILYHINKMVFKRTFHIMVREDTMQKNGFMKYLGAFSIPQGKQMVTSLNYAALLLSQPGNMVVVFPQGKLHSNFIDKVDFEKGLQRIIQNTDADFQYLFAASFIENFQHKKPSVYCNFKTAGKNDFATFDELKKAYQQHYQTAKLNQTTIAV